MIWNNYLNEISKKIKDLDRVIDASSQDKRIVNGYHVCEANVNEVAKTRKGKISMKVLFDDNEEYELMLSYTKAVLPANKEEYTIWLK